MYVIARYSHSAHVIRNQLFLVGGVNVNHSVPGVACVDMNSKKVTEFQIPVSILKNVGNKMKEGGGGLQTPKKILSQFSTTILSFAPPYLGIRFYFINFFDVCIHVHECTIN